MKKIIILVLVLFTLSACSNVKNGVPTPKQEQVIDLPSVEPDHYLYHITDAQGNGMYLLGSIHVGQKPMEVDGKLLDAYNDSEAISFEVNDFTITDSIMELSQEMLTINPLSEIEDAQFDEKFKQLDEEYDYINEELIASGYNLTYLQQMTLAELMEELSLKSEYGVDMTLLNKAMADEKELLEVEGITMQFNLFMEFEEKCASYMMDSTFISKSESEQDLIDSLKTYANGTFENYALSNETIWMTNRDMPIPEELYETQQEMQEYETYRDLMLINRQDDMYLKCVEYIKNDNTLLVVGAMHLIGADGLLALFEDNGYTVTKQ